MGQLRTSVCVFLLCSVLLFLSAQGSAHRAKRALEQSFIDKHVYKQYEFEENFKNDRGRYPNEEEISADVVKHSRMVVETFYTRLPKKHSLLLIKTPSQYQMLTEDLGTDHGEPGADGWRKFKSSNEYEVAQMGDINLGSNKHPRLGPVTLGEVEKGKVWLGGRPNGIDHFDGMDADTKRSLGQRVRPIPLHLHPGPITRPGTGAGRGTGRSRQTQTNPRAPTQRGRRPSGTRTGTGTGTGRRRTTGRRRG